MDNLKSMLFTDEELDKCTAKKGDLLVCEGGNVGRACIWTEDFDIRIQNHIHKLRPYSKVEIKYFYYIFYLYKSAGLIGGKGIGIQGLSSGSLHNLILPIPSYNEQQRIVTKLEKVLPIVERYESEQNSLDYLNSEIKPRLRKSILQEAIQGRLVAQTDTDEPASVLLEKIRAEKERLVKDVKLKKSALEDSVIFKGDDNKYYEQIDGQQIEVDCDIRFPQSWQLCRLSFICQLIDGFKTKGKQICLDAKYLRGKSDGTIIEKGKFVSKGDNIILVDGENSGEVFTVPVDGYMGSTFKQLWVSETMNLQYVLFVIRFYKEMLRNSKKGAAIPHLNKHLFYNIVVGIPPIEEQVRIVEKVNQLLQLSD